MRSLKSCIWKLMRICLNDEYYLRLKYRRIVGDRLNLKHPESYNEKLQWLKLYNHRPEYTILVDKYLVKAYIAKKIGEQYVIPLLGVWDSFDEINFDELPEKFVLKTNHNSGNGVFICRDKSSIDLDSLKKKISESLNDDYYKETLEWPYKDINKKIIAEQYIEDAASPYLTDYKLFCFNGVPKIAYISKDSADHPTTDFFDMDFNPLPIKMRDPNSEVKPSKPDEFEEMKRLASVLSEGIPHVRVDFYLVDGKIYFGEMTFFHCSGFAKVYPEEWNLKMGGWINLPEVKVR